MTYIVRSAVPPEPLMNIQNYYVEIDEFLSDSGGSLNWTAVVSGTGAAITNDNTLVNSTDQAIGVYLFSTGTTSTGRAALVKNTACKLFGYATFTYKTRLKLTTLSSATQRYTAYFGFIDNSGAGDMTDGVYFRYIDNVNSGNWQLVARSNTTESVTTRASQQTPRFMTLELKSTRTALLSRALLMTSR